MPTAFDPDLARQLLDAAREVAQRAWAPYSNFPVGAAIFTDQGEVISGCNVENAAYGETICAERNAVTTMVATGQRKNASDTAFPASGAIAATVPQVRAVAVVGLNAAPCWPCGACRQVLREFHCQHVIVEDASGKPVVLPFEQILPHSFGPEALDTFGPEALQPEALGAAAWEEE